MAFNNTYFLEANANISFEDVLLKTIDQINTYTTNSFFLEQEILAETRKNLFVNAQEFYSKTNKLILSKGKNSIAEKFTISFAGEGILFRLEFIKNEEWKDGYIALEFSPENHSLLKALERVIANLLNSKVQPTKIEAVEISPEKKVDETIALSTSKSNTTCRCNTATTYASGAYPILISDFTTNYITHYQYNDWDQWGIFTCNDCQKNWFIKSSYTDRPPYVSSADTIDEQKVKNLKRFSSDVITEILKLEGVYLLAKIVDGQDIDVEGIRAKHVPKCRCGDFGDDEEGDKISAITQVTDSNERNYQHKYKDEYVVIYSCTLCKTPWLFYFSLKPSGKNGWAVKKITENQLNLLLKSGTENLNLQLETEGVKNVLKLIV